MSLFEKKVPVFRKRDKDTWLQIKQALKGAGVPFSAGHYEQDNIPVGGYSALDPRNFGKGGRIDREIYYVNVKVSQKENALEVIRLAGLVTEVQDVSELTMDASKKIKDTGY